MSPIKGKPLILYVTALDTYLGALLVQNNDESKEVSLYYLNQTLVGAKSNYSPIEKSFIALIFSIQKLQHFFLFVIVHLISKVDSLKYIMSQPTIQVRIASQMDNLTFQI